MEADIYCRRQRHQVRNDFRLDLPSIEANADNSPRVLKPTDHKTSTRLVFQLVSSLLYKLVFRGTPLQRTNATSVRRTAPKVLDTPKNLGILGILGGLPNIIIFQL